MGMAAILIMEVRPFKQNLHSLFPRGFHVKFDLDWPSGFEKKLFENDDHAHVYSPWQGQKTPMVKVFFLYDIIFC